MELNVWRAAASFHIMENIIEIGGWLTDFQYPICT